MENTQSRNPNITNSTSSDMENTHSVFDAKVTIRGTLHTLTSIKELLGQSLMIECQDAYLWGGMIFGETDSPNGPITASPEVYQLMIETFDVQIHRFEQQPKQLIENVGDGDPSIVLKELAAVKQRMNAIDIHKIRLQLCQKIRWPKQYADSAISNVLIGEISCQNLVQEQLQSRDMCIQSITNKMVQHPLESPKGKKIILIRYGVVKTGKEEIHLDGLETVNDPFVQTPDKPNSERFVGKALVEPYTVQPPTTAPSGFGKRRKRKARMLQTKNTRISFDDDVGDDDSDFKVLSLEEWESTTLKKKRNKKEPIRQSQIALKEIPLVEFHEDLSRAPYSRRTKVKLPECLDMVYALGDDTSHIFPWGNNDIFVYRSFWLNLLGLRDGGWLSDIVLKIFPDCEGSVKSDKYFHNYLMIEEETPGGVEEDSKASPSRQWKKKGGKVTIDDSDTWSVSRWLGGLQSRCIVARVRLADPMVTHRSMEDHVIRISKSVFVTNFPDAYGSRDLWKLCETYGKVVDVFIPNRLSKAGKRFAFVRFIKVDDIDRLLSNLCTLWVGRFHIHANAVRYERPSKPHHPHPQPRVHSRPSPGSFAGVVKDPTTQYHPPSPPASSPALVLEESCFIGRDLSRHVMGKVKDLHSIPNLMILLAKEGFPEVKVSYLGGLWVLLELVNVATCKKLAQHIGVNSWFSVIQPAMADFVCEERVVWVDIEGIPLHLWSRDTFIKIGSKWGATMDIEENLVNSFARKRLCIKTNVAGNILENFKVIFKGRVYLVRAKELFAWTPSFIESKDSGYGSDDDSIHGFNNKSGDKRSADVGMDDDSDLEGVSETIFSTSTHNSNHNSEKHVDLQQQETQQHSPDPFELYDLLHNKTKRGEDQSEPGIAVPEPSLSHPPGFTPVNSQQENSHNQAHVQYSVNILDAEKEKSPSVQPNVMNSSQEINDKASSSSASVLNRPRQYGGSVLEVLDDMVRVGQSMGYDMHGCLGNKTKKEWIKELNNKYKINFLAIQETKLDVISHMDVKFIWGNSNYQFVCHGLPSNTKILFVVIYAPQSQSLKRSLWEYISSLIARWNGESIVMGDFNEVRFEEERFGSNFNKSSARAFNQFISASGLVDVKLEGYSFTWSHPSGNKMSKLDRFLVSEGIFSSFPSLLATCLDRHLSDHRPILLNESLVDYGPIPFRVYHSWFKREGFDDMVHSAWNSFSHSDPNLLIRFKKKLQALKAIIRAWIKDKNLLLSGTRNAIVADLSVIDKQLDNGYVSDDLILKRMGLMSKLQDLKRNEATDLAQKAKIKWAIEGDENTNFFHDIINKRRSQLAILGVLVDGDLITDPLSVKDVFKEHIASHLEKDVSRVEIRNAVWGCGENKSPGPDGFTFEFFKRYWDLIGTDFCGAVKSFFDCGTFPRGNNASFIALIPKVADAKFVTDFRPISLIGSIYKVITKILADRLSLVISDLISDTQSAFVANRQILDGPFIMNEVLDWCKRKRKKALFFKVDFAKAYDSIRWDYLLDVLHAFGFGPNWCKWIQGIFSSAHNPPPPTPFVSPVPLIGYGSPTSEFPFFRGLKQGDPLAPFLFILVMESLHLSVSRAVNEGVFKGIQLHESLMISHLFYADDVMFLGEWSDTNLKSLTNILKCFFLASGLKINFHKSQLLGIGVPPETINQGASLIGCGVLHTPFNYLGVPVGNLMSRHSAWTSVIQKLRARLSNWKVKTLSIGGRLTLLKSVLGASPLYSLSIFKAPKQVLHEMEQVRSNFFNGADQSERKISWVAWDKTLASKKKGGLGISSFHALNRAYGLLVQNGGCCAFILGCLKRLSSKGFNFVARCKKRVGDGQNTKFWLDAWKSDIPFRLLFPWLFALEVDKEASVASKMGSSSVADSFRRQITDPSVSSVVRDVRISIDDLLLPSSGRPTRCEVSQHILRKICRWWDLVWFDVLNFSDWDGWFDSVRLPFKLKLLLEAKSSSTLSHLSPFLALPTNDTEQAKVSACYCGPDMENTHSIFDVKVTIRGTLHTLTSIKELLGQSINERRRTGFLSTVFGKWLDFPAYSNDNLLMNYIFQHEWEKDPFVIPRGLAWSKIGNFEKGDYGALFAEWSNLIMCMAPTSTELDGDPSIVLKAPATVKQRINAIERFIKSRNDNMSEDSVAKQSVEKEIESSGGMSIGNQFVQHPLESPNGKRPKISILDVLNGEVSFDKKRPNIYHGESSKNEALSEEFDPKEYDTNVYESGDGKVSESEIINVLTGEVSCDKCVGGFYDGESSKLYYTDPKEYPSSSMTQLIEAL
ncbi:RNA-directed DNA polymerase, eukaryota, partial [Tanacetum coccineum]